MTFIHAFSSFPKRAARFSLCVLVALTVHNASAVPLYWSGNATTQGGIGNWDTTTSHWGTASTGPYAAAWDNLNNDTAVFAGTSGTVTLDTNVIVGGLQFNTNSYNIATGAGTTITFGTAGAINVSTGTSTISAVVAGSSAISKTGAGTIALSGNNTYTGNTVVSAGTLTIGISPNTPGTPSSLGSLSGGV